MTFLKNMIRVIAICLCLMALIGVVWITMFYRSPPKSPEGTLVHVKMGCFEEAA